VEKTKARHLISEVAYFLYNRYRNGRKAKGHRLYRKIIDWWRKCRRAPNGATLLHSPGRKPWVNCFHTFIESQRGNTFSTNRNTTKQILALLVPLLRSSFYFCPCVPRVPFRALPSLHP